MLISDLDNSNTQRNKGISLLDFANTINDILENKYSKEGIKKIFDLFMMIQTKTQSLKLIRKLGEMCLKKY